MVDRILRLPQVLELTGLSRSTIYAAIEAGTFPRQVPLGGRAVGWPESSVSAWIEERVALANVDQAASYG